MNTTVMLLSGFLLAMGAGGVLLWRLLRQCPVARESLREDELLAANASGLGSYRPMNRLFAEEDYALY